MEFETAYALEMFFPRSAFVQVYLEVIANALDAGATEVEIAISTEGKVRPPKQLEITVTDNGGGFTDDRFDRFSRVKRPSDSHHKGLGRLVYLQYFKTISVTSIFNSSRRSFVFTRDFTGKSEVIAAEKGAPQRTSLHFHGFIGERVKSYDDLKPGSLHHQVVDHFLPRLYDLKNRGTDFRITITLDTREANEQRAFFADTQVITPADIPTLQTKTFRDDSIDSFSDIKMAYMVQTEVGQGRQLIAVSVDGRTVPLTKLLPQSAIPFATTAIFLFESELFTGKSDSTRQRLVLSETVSESNLYRVLRREVSAVLSALVPEIETKNSKTKQHFEERYWS